MKTGYVIGGILVLAVALVLVFTSGSSSSDAGSVTGNVVAGNAASGGSEPDVTFEITGGNFRFFLDGVESPDLKVKQGDKVRIVFNNKEGFHDWVVDEFNARTQQIEAGSTETIEFVADKKVTFEYYCIVGKHRANGMLGKFIVE